MMHVDNIIDLYRDYEKNYYTGMKALSQMGEFIDIYNLDYVSLNDNSMIPAPQKFKDGCVINDKEGSEYNESLYDQCYEDTKANVLSFNDFQKRVNTADTEDLLLEFFQYKFYNDGESEEARTNTLPTLLEKTGDELSNFSTEAQEAVFGGTIGDIVRKVFTNDSDVEKYLEEFESGKLAKFDKEYLQSFIHGEGELNLIQATKLCGMLSENIAADLKKNQLIKRHEKRIRTRKLVTYKDKEIQEKLREKCLKSINFNPETGRVDESLISFDRRYKVIETGTYEHKEGKNLNINVGYDFSVSDGKIVSVSTGLGISGSVNPLGAIPKIGDIASLNISASKDIAQDNYVSLDRGSSVSTETFLVVQQATMEIELKKFERCFTASIMPNMYYDLVADDLDLIEGKKIGDADVARSLVKGMMVCEGKFNEAPEKVIENYYYITQHFTAGDMLDEGNLLNHVWLLPLRGDNDFYNFMDLVNAKPIDNDGEVIAEEDRYIYSNLRLRKNFGQVLPSFPGMYTVQSFK